MILVGDYLTKKFTKTIAKYKSNKAFYSIIMPMFVTIAIYRFYHIFWEQQTYICEESLIYLCEPLNNSISINILVASPKYVLSLTQSCVKH